MANGISLHVGINQVGPNFPGAELLRGAENDAREMARLAAQKGFAPETLLGSNATYQQVTTKILNAATALYPGDIFLFTFSGHGFEETDQGEQDENDFDDETILLYDFELFDDILRQTLWPRFKAGVRILMIADSCHSGTVASKVFHSSDAPARSEAHRFVRRTISRETARLHMELHRAFYEHTPLPLLSPAIVASVLLVAACRDNEETADGFPNGVFTTALLKVMNQYDPINYRDFVARIALELAMFPQTPQLTPTPPPDEAFIGEKPFTI